MMSCGEAAEMREGTHLRRYRFNGDLTVILGRQTQGVKGCCGRGDDVPSGRSSRRQWQVRWGGARFDPRR